MPTPPQHILIRGGRVVDPATNLDRAADVLLAGERVVAIEPHRIASPPGATVIDAEGCIVAPGLIDIHVHFRDPCAPGTHEETVASGSASAVAGGFTTVACMPNTTPPLDTPAVIEHITSRAADAAGARVFTVACATEGRRGERVSDVASLARAGAIAFSDDGDCVADESVMAAVLRAVAAADSCFMQHCQEPSLTRGAAMNAGPVADALGLIGWPNAAEEMIIERDVRLNRVIGCRYHAQHVSSGGSVDIIREARADGVPVTGEASPHHLLLTDDACRTLGPAAKMNPPLRTADDVTRLKVGVADGTITVLATDHAPHPAATKTLPFADAAFGIVGLDCALPLYAQALIADGVIDWPRMIAMMTIEPATLVGLDRGGIGRLAIDGPGDVTVIDPDLEWTIDTTAFASAGRNCPFDGWRVSGRSVATIVAGHLRHDRLGDRRVMPSA